MCANIFAAARMQFHRSISGISFALFALWALSWAAIVIFGPLKTLSPGQFILVSTAFMVILAVIFLLSRQLLIRIFGEVARMAS